MIEPGQPAPDFSLVNQHGETITLSQYRGSKNVLLVFFPYAFTGRCTGELGEIRDRLEVFDNDDTVTLAVSVDSKFVQRVYADQEGYSFSLLADFWPHGQVAQQYGVLVEQAGAAKRGSFVIDKAGIVRWTVVHEIGQSRDTAEYETALKSLGG